MPRSEEYLKRMWAALNKINDQYEGVAPGDIGITNRFMDGYMHEMRKK